MPEPKVGKNCVKTGKMEIALNGRNVGNKEYSEEVEISIKERDSSLRNVIVLSFSFMFIFTALFTTGNIEQTILKSMQKDDPTFKTDGYVSLAISYLCFAVSNFFAPSLVAVLKAKRTLILCSIFYVTYILNFIFPSTWSLYSSSALLGIAAAGLWTAQGNYITLNSNPETISRNTGIFWVFLCSSQFVGNGFVFWQFLGKTHIDSHTRILVMSFLAVIGTIGTISLFFLNETSPNSPKSSNNNNNNNAVELDCQKEGKASKTTEILKAFKSALSLLKARQMQLLILTFIFLGTNQSFLGGIYPTSVGFTKQFGPIAKSLVGLSGICTGVGGLIGGGFVLLFGDIIYKKAGRLPIAGMGCLILTISYVLVYLNIPDKASLGPTEEVSYINPPSSLIAMLCSIFLGLGDALLHTQVNGTLSTIWPDDSAGAFATLHFFKSISVSFQFFYSTQSGLIGQFSMLQGLSIISVIAFAFVDRKVRVEIYKDKKMKEGLRDGVGITNNVYIDN